MPRYEFVEGSSSKFWDIQLDGTSFVTTYGRIGTDGQSSMKEFDTAEKARKEYDKLVAEKVKKGYELVDGDGDDDEDVDDAPTERPAPAPKAAPAKAAPKAAPPPAAATGDASAPRYFEFVEGSSSKFWEVKLEGTAVMTRYGRIGSAGQETMKEFDSDAKARKEYDKLVAEKTGKGYVESGGAAAAPAAPAPAPKPAAKAAPKAKAAPPPEDDDEDDDDEDDDDEGGGGSEGARYFEFVEGSSSKFWEIKLEGTAVLTRYGRIGAAGQESMKEFDSEAKAQKEYDKLVGEKTKKGYEEK